MNNIPKIKNINQDKNSDTWQKVCEYIDLIAIENVKKELEDFAQRLIKINETENLNISKIDKLFVYGRIDDEV